MIKTKNNNYGPAVWLLACLLLFTAIGIAQTTTTNLGISKPQAGQAQPNVTIATGFDNFDSAVAGRLSKSVAGSSNVTLTTTEARNAILEFTGILTGSINVIVPTLNRTYLIYNGTTGAFTLTVKTAAGTGIAVTQATRVWLYCDATNVVETSVSSGGANTTLSNLSTTSINAALLAQTGVDLGSTVKPFRDLFLFGGGTYGTNYFRFTGTPTSTRTLTIPDRTATLATTTGTLTSGRCVEFDATGNLVDAVSASPCGAGSGSTIVDWKDSVRVATTVAGTLATSFENGDTIDGVVLATGNRILLKDQSSGADNGIYVVAASGAPARATDAETSAEVTAGMAVMVVEGTVNADRLYTLTTNDTITLGSTSLVFSNLTASGATSWSGITDPSTSLSLAMGLNPTTFTWAGNFASSAFKLAGNNTTTTQPLLHLATASSNLIPPLLVEVRGSNQRLKVGHLGDVVIGQGAMGASDTDGFPYIPTIGSNSFPTSTPTGQTGFAPIVAYSNGVNTEYDLAVYLNSAWKSVCGAYKRYDTVSGTGAQTLNFNSNSGGVVTREFTATGTSAAATLTFSNPPPAGSLVVVTVIQGGGGSNTVTWPGTVKWTAGTAPTLTTTVAKRDTFVFMWNGSSYYNTSQLLNQ